MGNNNLDTKIFDDQNLTINFTFDVHKEEEYVGYKFFFSSYSCQDSFFLSYILDKILYNTDSIKYYNGLKWYECKKDIIREYFNFTKDTFKKMVIKLRKDGILQTAQETARSPLLWRLDIDKVNFLQESNALKVNKQFKK